MRAKKRKSEDRDKMEQWLIDSTEEQFNKWVRVNRRRKKRVML